MIMHRHSSAYNIIIRIRRRPLAIPSCGPLEMEKKYISETTTIQFIQPVYRCT